MENKARGEMKGKSLLVLIAVFKNAQLKKCLESQTYLCSPLLILWFIFSSVHRCSQRSPGDWIQLYGIILKRDTEVFACRRAQSAVTQRSLHPHWGRFHQRPLKSLACHTVLMFAWRKCKWSVIFG